MVQQYSFAGYRPFSVDVSGLVRAPIAVFPSDPSRRKMLLCSHKFKRKRRVDLRTMRYSRREKYSL